MTETQLQHQRTQAKAAWNLTKLRLRSGQANPADVEQARLVYEALTTAHPTSEPAQPSRPIRPPGTSLPPAVAALVNTIRAEQGEISRRKAELSNSLGSIPDELACPDVVGQILTLRRAWVEKQDEIRYALDHGHRPAQEPVKLVEDSFSASLPTDKFELDRLIRYEKSKLSKYRSGLDRSSTEAKKQHYRTQIAKAELKLERMLALFKAL
ncbi:hypothetical protein [Larkinella terrae]|uniref:Uncharacterized protein n=1 Tax=Larkinella terrae TaxID=2025311 RepID=A0A7K0EJE0_9BACT|nr:hypothetical protein [Larkinella terrae]MRS61904.1 hypothetical protein [Larkinella terrae]